MTAVGLVLLQMFNYEKENNNKKIIIIMLELSGQEGGEDIIISK